MLLRMTSQVGEATNDWVRRRSLCLPGWLNSVRVTGRVHHVQQASSASRTLGGSLWQLLTAFLNGLLRPSRQATRELEKQLEPAPLRRLSQVLRRQMWITKCVIAPLLLLGLVAIMALLSWGMFPKLPALAPALNRFCDAYLPPAAENDPDLPVSVRVHELFAGPPVEIPAFNGVPEPPRPQLAVTGAYANLLEKSTTDVPKTMIVEAESEEPFIDTEPPEALLTEYIASGDKSQAVGTQSKSTSPPTLADIRAEFSRLSLEPFRNISARAGVLFLLVAPLLIGFFLVGICGAFVLWYRPHHRRCSQWCFVASLECLCQLEPLLPKLVQDLIERPVGRSRIWELLSIAVVLFIAAIRSVTRAACRLWNVDLQQSMERLNRWLARLGRRKFGDLAVTLRRGGRRLANLIRLSCPFASADRCRSFYVAPRSCALLPLAA